LLSGQKLKMRKINKIIIHCTATPEGRHTTVEDVRRWHLDRGWSDIGYHFLIYLDGSLHEGRPVEIPGAHCKGHNKESIGIAYVGGIDKVNFKPKDTRTEEQKEALVYILEYLKIQHADAVIHGHNDFADKACPSFNATKEYENITNMWK
jgi:N-acetylmuramoyl-L-alanine amidase